jgi:formylglycine-generating enzyme required for sulfatase activity
MDRRPRKFARESDRGPEDPQTHAFGSFGANENGLLDLGGNVWEWTSRCFVRTALDNAGSVLSKNPNCGVRVAEGQHRAYVTDFIRDARAGGCAVGLPPRNLGFRLVREPKASAISALPESCANSSSRSDPRPTQGNLILPFSLK